MKIIGLVGGIGSGKSTASEIFSQLGARVIDADRLGHETLRFPEIKSEIRRLWGEAVFGDGGEVDRRQMAAIVFSGDANGDEQLAKLKAITHPKIGELIQSEIAEAKAVGTKLVLIDAPLLLEGKWDALCSEILYIDAPEEVRIERALKRGWTRDEYFARAANQFPLETKKAAATTVITNDGDLESLRKQIRDFFCKLTDG